MASQARLVASLALFFLLPLQLGSSALGTAYPDALPPEGLQSAAADAPVHPAPPPVPRAEDRGTASGSPRPAGVPTGNENWSNLFGLAGLNGPVYAIVIEGTDVYVGGSFTSAAGVSVSNVARWDGHHWNSLGSGTNGYVNALVLDGLGNLYAGGGFTKAGGLESERVAAWDGAAWSALASGFDNDVNALAITADGKLHAGGSFLSSGATPVSRVARWSGSAWEPLGVGVSGPVHALAADGNRLYVGGSFPQAGGQIAHNIAAWESETWSVLGQGTDNWVHALTLHNSILYAGGSFTTAGLVTANGVAYWNGSWNTVGTGVSGTEFSVNALLYDSSHDNLYACGRFDSAGGVPAANIARWSGAVWNALGGGLPQSGQSLALAAGVLYAGADNDVKVWNDSMWGTLGYRVDDTVRALTGDGSGGVYAGGEFSWAGGESASRIAHWDGSAWHPLQSVWGTVSALTRHGSDLYVGGSITRAGASTVNNIARWDGGNFNRLGVGTSGNGVDGPVYAIAVDSVGVVYVGGDFDNAGGAPAANIAKWDGVSWSALGGGTDGPVHAIAVDSADNVFAGGDFLNAGSTYYPFFARWSAGSWTHGGGVNSIVKALLPIAVDDVIVGGEFSWAGLGAAARVARWDDSVWSPLDEGMNLTGIFALARTENGIVLAGGSFTEAGGSTAYSIAAWDGSAWWPLGDGVEQGVYALAGSGDVVFVGGNFDSSGGQLSPHVAIWKSSYSVHLPLVMR